MNSILLLFFSLSLSGSLLAIILLGIKPLIKKRLSQTWQYYIWLIVILRFLLPFTSQMSVVGEMTRYFQGAITTPTVGEINLEINENRDIITSTSPQVPNTSQEVSNPQEIKTEAEEHTTYWNEILNNIWVLWLGVALVLFAQKVTSYRSFVRFVKIGTKEITDAHIWDIYVTELTKAKVKRSLPLYVNDQVVSPMLIGILHPSIVMPTLNINDDELRHIFRHVPDNYKQIVKTLAGTDIQNINIDAAYCILQFEQTSNNTLEVVFSYPEITAFDYEKYFNLRMEKNGSSTVNIYTDHNNRDFINDIEGIDDTPAILTIKIPQKQYNNVKLNLFAINSQTIDFGFNTSTLEIVSSSADTRART